MDRGKSGQSSRGGAKNKITQYPTDIFALGSKPSTSRDDAKRSSSLHSKSSSSSSHQTSSKVSGDRKREGSLTSGPSSKKPKVSSVIRAVASGNNSSSSGNSSSERPGPSTSQPQTSLEQWETIAVDSDPKDFIISVMKFIEDSEMDKAAAYICGAIKLLRTQRYKPDKVIYISLIYIAKYKPTLFLSEHIVAGLASLLKRDTTHSFKSKGNPAVPVLSANLLLRAHLSVQHWPELFVRLYVDDALGDRIWVDHEECRSFVDNIVTAFNTRVPPKTLLAPELSGALTGSRDTSSPLTVDDDTREGRSTPEIVNISASEKEGNVDIPILPRYSQSHEVVEQIVLEAIKEQLNRRQPPETITRNFLRLLSSACGLVEIRIIAVSRLEMWLHNPKLMRPAQELLAYLCCNCVSVTQRDLEVTAYLTKIRLKTKALINVYLNCLRELLTTHNENLPSMLKHTIFNELSSARNPNNMPMIAVMFQAAPETAANVLAEIFQDLLYSKDDYLRSLRALLREIVRVLRFDINLYALCRSLVKERKEILPTLRDFENKDRMFAAIGDLVCLAMFLGISPQVKEAAGLLARGDKKEIATLQSYQMLVAKIQKEAVTWLHEVALRTYRPSPQDFMHVLHKVLFLESAEQYYKVDMWPSESDRNLFLRLASEVPLLQATLVRILLIGISKDHPLNAPDTLELTDQLIKRAAGLPSEGFACLQADKLEIIDLIFNLTAYHYPDNISLPQGYNPPQLAISNLYWKGWIMLLMLAAHNPSTFGNQAWKKYPMLRTFMEMCITNHFAYPPPTVAMGEMYEDMKNKELQIAAMDKQQILEFESHLAAASTKMTITEQSSLLLSQLIEMSPMGEPRQPPQAILDQLGALNGTHRMGHLLCRSRNPDFLLEIIQRQGSSQHMPWLADLVHNSEGALSHLPVQCLCEYLLISGMQEKNEKHRKHSQVLTHLQTVLTDATQDYTASYEILEYFLRRLNSLHCASRVQAIKGLKMVLSTVVVEDEPVDMENVLETNDRDLVDYWLLRQIPNLPHFMGHIRPLMVNSLRQACQVETNPDHVSSYINFLAQQTLHDSLSEMLDLVLDMAQLIVERSTIIAAVLPIPEQENRTAYNTLHSLMIMFCSYLSKAKEPRHETISWSESQDHVLITWASGEECTMHILVVHAMIILLTYGPANDHELFNTLLETWFPLNGEQPKAYLVDTSEEALLIPDWLKLRMIRSTVPRLVDAALINLEPSQLVLFIQSFGIPVSSMTKLLCNLDSAVTIDQNSVDEAVLDKCYMAQLVEVQHRRGATGGNTFVQVLQLLEPKLPDEETIEIENTKEMFPVSAARNFNKNIEFNYNSLIALMNSLYGNVIVDANKNKGFGNLIRVLMKEINSSGKCHLQSEIINYLQLNITSPEFINKLVQEEHYSCTLVRLMVTSKKDTDQLIELSRNILPRIEQKQSILYDIFKQYLKKQNAKKSENKVKKIVYSDNPVEVLEKTDLASLEKIMKQLVDQNLEKVNNAELVKMMSKLLLTDAEARKFDRTGLLVDWLAELEMEIIGSSPELQMGLLFSKPSFKSDPCLVFRPYLLTLLTHRVSWSTLHACVSHLLSNCSPKYDPTAVLDFLWALTCNPKLWQGRDKFTPKNYRPENVLWLNNVQITTLVNYILEEACQVYNTHSSTSDCILKMESRLQLLIQSFSNQTDSVAAVVRYLREYTKQQDVEVMEVITLDDSISDTESSKTKGDVAQEFLVLLYMKLPKITYILNNGEKKKICKLSHISDYSTSVVDNISHTLFTALAATPRSKDWGRKGHEFDLLARKMAAVHPALILRQLPMIATGLKGRTHLDFSVFKSRNHLTLFYQVLGVIELLIPEVFEDAHKEGLEGILRSYFSLFKNHGHVKELHTILGRFVSLLQAFMSHYPAKALVYLQQYAHLLYDLHLTYSNLRPLRSLMSSISLPKEEGFADNIDTGEVLVAVARPPSPEPVPPNWANLVSNIGKLQDDEMTSVLQEIDHVANRRPAILESIIDQISLLTLSPASAVRQLAHVLLVRYLKHNPVALNMSSPILSSILQCLESSNADVVNSALDKLPDIVTCLQEHADHILEKAFILGVKSNINTSPNIIKAINILNIQSGA